MGGLWRACCAAAIVALVTLAGLSASADEVEYHATYDAALAAAKKSRGYVMIILTAPGCGYCTKLKDEALPSEPIAKLVRDYFAPVVVDLGEVRAGRQKLPEPVKTRFVQGNQIKIPGVPFVLFADRNGKVVDEIKGYAPPEHYHTMLKKVTDKLAAKTPPKDRREVERSVRRGQEAMSRKDYRAAFGALQAALGGGVPGEELDQARRMAAEIESKAAVVYEDGRALEGEEKLGSAIRKYRECVRDFKGTKTAQQAVARLEELRDDPELRQRLGNFVASRLVADAEKAVARGDYGEAATAVDKVLERYPKADAAPKAKALKTKLESDPEIAGRVRESRVKDEAQRMLRLAATYRRNKMAAKALATYKKVVEKFPDTSFAKTASDNITELSVETEN